MRLRRLELRDAPLMLEWMHDKYVIENMRIDFLKRNLADCENFIVNSWKMVNDLHLAIVDNNDIYMGTVSLKHITENSAEFAIIIRSSAMGKGISKEAMEKMINIGLEKMNLQQIYWCVSPENKRAIKFYDKNGYDRVETSELINYNFSSYSEDYLWYQKIKMEKTI